MLEFPVNEWHPRKILPPRFKRHSLTTFFIWFLLNNPCTEQIKCQ
jgi:hypothetical protein